MNTPDIKNVRSALVGLAVLAIGLTLAAGARATEIGTSLAERTAQLSQANFSADETSSADVSGVDWALEAESVFPPSLVDHADAAESSDEATRRTGRGEGDADPLSISSLATWFPEAADLSFGDTNLVDMFAMVSAAIPAIATGQSVSDTFWELQDGERSARAVDLRPLESELRERDSFVAAEVAFALGNVGAPDPDVVFLAFVVLQSLWGLACRPRKA
jgi:hypothetical protein